MIVIYGFALAEPLKRDRVDCSPMSASLNRLRPQSINTNIVYVKKNQTIQEAIDLITDESATNPYTVIVPAGLYREKIVLSDYISLQGTGISSTIITGDGSSIGIEIANQCSIKDLTVDGVTYSGAGDTCNWAIGCDDTHSNETVYIENCGFYAKASFVHIEGASNIGYIRDCVGKTVWDTYVGFDTATLNVWNCYTEMLYHVSNSVRTIYLVADDAVINVWNSDAYMNLTAQGINVYGAQSFTTTETDTATINLYNCRFDFTATSGSGEQGCFRVAGANRKIYVQGGKVQLSYTGNEFAGTSTYGAILEMYNVDVNKKIKSTLANPGTLKGIPLEKVNRGVMSGHETFNSADGTLFIRDPGGAARNFNPYDTYFLDGTIITLINIADAAETITFDSAGLNQAVAQNERGIFAYHKTDGWLKIYVGS